MMMRSPEPPGRACGGFETKLGGDDDGDDDDDDDDDDVWYDLYDMVRFRMKMSLQAGNM
jgi:hypothetical protein